MSDQPDLSWWTEDSDREIRQLLSERVIQIDRLRGEERKRYVENVVRCVRVNERTAKRCGSKVAEVLKLDQLQLPGPLTVRAVLFRMVRQNPLGVDPVSFGCRHERARAVIQAMADRKLSYRLRDWDWKYVFEGVENNLPGTEFVFTACRCRPDEYRLSLARILSGEITTVGAPLDESDTP